MKKLFISKYEIETIEKRVGFTYTFNTFTGESCKFSSLFYSKEMHEQIALEVIGEENLLALAYCLEYASDCNKEDVRKLYTKALTYELTTKTPSTSETFQRAVNTLLAYSELPTEYIGKEMESVRKDIEKLYDKASEDIITYRNESNYLHKTMSESWFVGNSVFCNNFSVSSGTIYDEYPKRYDFLKGEINRLNEIINLCPWVISTLKLDFNLHDSCPPRSSNAARYLKNMLDQYLKDKRTEEVELYMKDLENKKFIQKQLRDKIDYFVKFKLLENGKVGEKLFVKKSKKSIEIFIVPEDYEGANPSRSKKYGIVKVFGKIGTTSNTHGWLYKGRWINEILDHLSKLDESENARRINEGKTKLEEELIKISNTSDILLAF